MDYYRARLRHIYLHALDELAGDLGPWRVFLWRRTPSACLTVSSRRFYTWRNVKSEYLAEGAR